MIDAPISLAGGGEGGGREVTTRKRQVLLIIEKVHLNFRTAPRHLVMYTVMSSNLAFSLSEYLTFIYYTSLMPHCREGVIESGLLIELSRLLCLQLYSLVLALEDLDKRALVLPEVERGVVSTRKEEICSEIFDLLRLKTLEKAGK